MFTADLMSFVHTIHNWRWSFWMNGSVLYRNSEESIVYFLMYFVAVGFLMLTCEMLWRLMCVSNLEVQQSQMNCSEA